MDRRVGHDGRDVRRGGVRHGAGETVAPPCCLASRCGKPARMALKPVKKDNKEEDDKQYKCNDASNLQRARKENKAE